MSLHVANNNNCSIRRRVYAAVICNSAVSCRVCLVYKEGGIGKSTSLLFSCRYWGLGFHNCRFGYRTIDIVEEVVANYSAAMVGRVEVHS